MKRSVFHQVFLYAIILFTITACAQGQAGQSMDTILSAIEPVFEGSGVPEAAVYDPQSPGPHKLLLLNHYGNSHGWNEELPSSWLPKNINEVELVVILGREDKQVVGSQSYTGIGMVTRSRYYQDLEIRSARTGELLVEGKVFGSSPREFPLFLSGRAEDLAGQPVTASKLVDQLYAIVMGRMLTATDAAITALSFSKNGKELAAAFEDGTIQVWETQKNSSPSLLTGSASDQAGLFPNLIYSYWSHEDGSDRYVISNQEQLEAVLKPDKSIGVGAGDWAGANPELNPKLEGGVRFMALHPNEAYLVIITRLLHYVPKTTPIDPEEEKQAVYYRMYLYHLKYAHVMHEIEIPMHDISVITFSRDGDQMAFGNSEGQILLLSIEDLLETR